jgi:hypothetical protein
MASMFIVRHGLAACAHWKFNENMKIEIEIEPLAILQFAYSYNAAEPS